MPLSAMLIAASAQAQPPAAGKQAEAQSGEQMAPPRLVPDCDSNAASGEIVVCGRSLETSRYRLPLRIDSGRFDPGGRIESVSRERNRLFDVGDSGAGSCSSVGPRGMEGCAFKEFKRYVEQYGK